MHLTLLSALIALLLLPAGQGTVPPSAPKAAPSMPAAPPSTAAPSTPASPAGPAEPPATYDAALAAKLGADEYGMRSFVLVILKSGPNRMPAGSERDEMFKGHFANMKRLSEEGTLVLAGPLDGVDGWRGLFVLAVGEIDEARQLASTDPVLKSGEMIAEYHKYYGSAALVGVRDLHARLAKKQM